MTWLAVGLVVGLACGGALVTWWSSRRLEREAARQYEMGIAEGVQIAERERGSGRRAGGANGQQRRRKALQKAVVADDAA